MKRGFAVFEPTRIGYGQFGTQFDPEYSGKCRQKDYAPMIDAARAEELAVLEYARRQPHVDPHRIVIVGQSVGGFVTTAMAAENPDGVVGAINFAGGSGGDPVEHPGVPCQGERLEAMYSRFGKTARVPMLWIYTENDQYFAPTYSSAWHDAFVRAGGNADYRLCRHSRKTGTCCSRTVSMSGSPWSPSFSIVRDFPCDNAEIWSDMPRPTGLSIFPDRSRIHGVGTGLNLPRERIRPRAAHCIEPQHEANPNI